jgi:GT2 family glycosyltransferase
MATPPVVRVLVPSYRGADLRLDCLATVLASEGVDARVLVVDDASGDGTVAALRARHPQVEVLENERNVGFAGTCNRGLARLLEEGAEEVFLLNQDTRLAPTTLAELHAFLGAHPRAAAVGPKTYSFLRALDGRERLIYAGAWRRWLPLRQQIPGIERVETTPRRGAVEVDYIWGHGVLLRGDALREVGLFDTDYPMYYEDLDLCRRLRTAGHELWCLQSAVMWHDQPDGARSGRSDDWRWACKVRSVSVFHRKHYGALRAALLTPLTILSEAWELLRTRRARASVQLALAGLRHALGLAPASVGRSAP